MGTIRGPQLCRLVGISYRQLDYWCRTGRLQPSVPARGSGTQRLFSIRDAQLAWVLAQVAQLGLPIPNVAPLASLPAWRGWLVLHAHGTEVVADADELALYPVATIIDLEACPLLDTSSVPDMRVPA